MKLDVTIHGDETVRIYRTLPDGRETLIFKGHSLLAHRVIDTIVLNGSDIEVTYHNAKPTLETVVSEPSTTTPIKNDV